jgi:hypothetical protein
MTPELGRSEADARYLSRILEDSEGLLGPGTELLEARREIVGGGVRLVVRYRLGPRECESAGSGETVVEAHAALRTRIAEDRLRNAFTELVEGV